MPPKGRNNATIEVALNYRDLATMARYLASKGLFIKSKSDLLRIPFDIVLSIAVDKEGLEYEESTSSAMETLASYGLHNFNRSGRYSKALARTIVGEEQEKAIQQTLEAKASLMKESKKKEEIRRLLEEADEG